MKSAPFQYHAPRTLEAALAVFGEVEDPDDLKILAGGQSLMPMLALRLSQPRHIVDINGLASQHGRMRRAGDVLEIGALARQREAERSALIAQDLPLLAEALPMLAHPQIRNRGTLGGTIAHADPAAEFPTIALALDAVMIVAGPNGVRSVAAADFFVGFLTTSMEVGEILIRIDVPVLPEGSGSAFVEVSRRHGDFAMAGVAATVTIQGGVLQEARLAFSGVAQTPVRGTRAELSLAGNQPSDELIGAAVAKAVADLSPTADSHASGNYRRHIAGVIATQALTTAIERARS